MAKLDRYRAKRDFGGTPEPAGDVAPPPKDAPRFVVHEHHARRLHWDLRLERNGVLASWALPRGLPPDPKRNNLAVHTEDHPLEYIDFKGTIPAGQYGAGEMHIYDSGVYVAEKFRDDEVIFTLHGEHSPVKYALFQTDGDQWLIHRMTPVEEGIEPMPEQIAPMLATPGSLPGDDEQWAYEIKWDGVRAIAYAGGGTLRLESRNANDITARYPELRPLARVLGARRAILDGEVVAFDEQGRPSFQRLQSRMHVTGEAKVRRLARDTPVALMLFDVLWLEGRPTVGLPYEARRELLLGLGLDGPAWKTPAHHVGDGEALREASRAQGLEGIVAKRLGSRYDPGRRSRNWVKVKNERRQELVVGGWLPGEGGRSGLIGALLLGYYDDEGRLHYAGRAGSGFTDAELDRVGALLDDLRTAEKPFDAGPRPPRDAVFAEPRLVAEIRFNEWTQAGTLRQPVYLGLRDDKDPLLVKREE